MMTKWDEDYIKAAEKVLNEGTKTENRTGTDTFKLPYYYFEFDLQKEFPILTTKQVYYRNLISEIQWIYQVQRNDIKWLHERNNHIWDEWMVDEDGYWEADQMYLDEHNQLQKGKVKKYFGKEYAGTIGTAYGYIIAYYDLMNKLLNSIQYNPSDRRRVINLYQEQFLQTGVLEPCVFCTEWDITGDYLNLVVHQRSCDMPLGLPFNVTQYAILLSMVAHTTGYKPGKILWTIKDLHIYENQIDGMKEQISRFHQNGSYDSPVLWLNPEVKNFYDFDTSKKQEDIKIKQYKHMGPIKFPVAK